MSKYALTGLVAEDVMIYGDNGKGWCPRIADCTPCEGEERHLSYAQAEKNAKFLVKCAKHHDELVAAAGELLSFCELAHHDRTVMTRLRNILGKVK